MTEEKFTLEQTQDVIYNYLGGCGCGLYYDRMEILKEVLNAFPLYESENVPDYLRTPLGEWLLCNLDRAQLIEHGTAIGGSWLNPNGEKLRDALNDEEIWKKIIEVD